MEARIGKYFQSLYRYVIGMCSNKISPKLEKKAKHEIANKNFNNWNKLLKKVNDPKQ